MWASGEDNTDIVRLLLDAGQYTLKINKCLPYREIYPFVPLWLFSVIFEGFVSSLIFYFFLLITRILV